MLFCDLEGIDEQDYTYIQEVLFFASHKSDNVSKSYDFVSRAKGIQIKFKYLNCDIMLNYYNNIKKIKQLIVLEKLPKYMILSFS